MWIVCPSGAALVRAGLATEAPQCAPGGARPGSAAAAGAAVRIPAAETVADLMRAGSRAARCARRRCPGRLPPSSSCVARRRAAARTRHPSTRAGARAGRTMGDRAARRARPPGRLAVGLREQVALRRAAAGAGRRSLGSTAAAARRRSAREPAPPPQPCVRAARRSFCAIAASAGSGEGRRARARRHARSCRVVAGPAGCRRRAASAPQTSARSRVPATYASPRRLADPARASAGGSRWRWSPARRCWSPRPPRDDTASAARELPSGSTSRRASRPETWPGAHADVFLATPGRGGRTRRRSRGRPRLSARRDRLRGSRRDAAALAGAAVPGSSPPRARGSLRLVVRGAGRRPDDRARRALRGRRRRRRSR